MRKSGKTILGILAAFLALGAAVFFYVHHAKKNAEESTSPAASVPATPVGLWTDPHARMRVKIALRGGTLTGVIVWLKHPLERDGSAAHDGHNKDPGLRARKIIGMELMGGFVRSKADPARWGKGWIYDPQNGDKFSCSLELKNASTLGLRGYLGFSALGKTESWTRVAP